MRRYHLDSLAALMGTSVVLCAELVGCASEPVGQGDDFDDAEPAQSRQSIANGTARTTNPFAAAILTTSTIERPGSWYTHCSGTVLKRTSTQSWVLTGRHCITTDGSIQGPLKPVSDLKVTTAVNPGVWVDPSTAYGVLNRWAVPTTVRDIGSDLAILQVAGRLPLEGSGYLGINVGPTSAVLGGAMTAYGYGMYVAGDADTVGTLRSGSGFPVVSDDNTSFVIGFDGSNGVRLEPGDSGGPILRTSAWGSSGNWSTIYGAHSTPVTNGMREPSTAGNWTWIQTQLGGVFISQAGALGTNLGSLMSPPSVDSQLRNGYTGDSARTRWNYDPAQGTLKLGGLCAYGSGTSITLKNCATSNQYRWDLLPNGGYARIRNRGQSTCITNESTPRLATCGTTSLAAVFHTQP